MAASMELDYLPPLPADVVDGIALRSAPTWLEWARTWRCVCTRYRSPDWFVKLGNGPTVVTPSADADDDDDASVRKHTSVHAAAMHATSAMAKRGGSGVVLVKPGVYRESLRITGAVLVMGGGLEHGAVLEGSGWEPALTFAGLGAAARHGHDVVHLDTSGTGERCCVMNLTFRNRNELNSTAVLIARGAPLLDRVTVNGCVWVGGEASPVLRDVRCCGSKGVGVRVTDRGSIRLRECALTNNRGAGVCADRGGLVVADATRLTENWTAAVMSSTTADVRLVNGTFTGPDVNVALRAGHHDEKVRMRMWLSLVMDISDEDLLHGLWEPLFDSDDFDEMLEMANQAE